MTYYQCHSNDLIIAPCVWVGNSHQTGTRRNDNIIMTSKRRDFDVELTLWSLCVRWVAISKIQINMPQVGWNNRHVPADIRTATGQFCDIMAHGEQAWEHSHLCNVVVFMVAASKHCRLWHTHWRFCWRVMQKLWRQVWLNCQYQSGHICKHCALILPVAHIVFVHQWVPFCTKVKETWWCLHNDQLTAPRPLHHYSYVGELLTLCNINQTAVKRCNVDFTLRNFTGQTHILAPPKYKRSPPILPLKLML